jgi:hypothetical protein
VQSNAKSYNSKIKVFLNIKQTNTFFGGNLSTIHIQIGSVALALFVVGLKTGWSIDKTKKLYKE